MKTKKPAQRRGNGEGTIYPIKDGRFGAAVSLGKDENGKRIRKVITGKTENDVREKMKNLLKDMQLVEVEEIGIDSHTLMEDFVKEFKLKVLMRDVLSKKISSRTYENYEYCLEKFTSTFVGEAVGVINTRRVNKFFADLIKNNYSQTYLDRISYIVNRMFIRACKRDYLSDNPFDNEDFITPKSTKQTEDITSLSVDELQKTIEVLSKNPEIYAVIDLMLGTGMRTQEVLGLCWGDINLNTGEVNICRAITIDVQYDKSGNKLSRATVLAGTKTDIKYHTVSISIDLIEKMKAWKALAPTIGKTKTGDDDFVFGNSRNNHWTYAGFRSSVNAYITREMEGVDSLRLHRVRHTVATVLAEDGASLLELMQMLGHTQTKTTMKYIDRVSRKMAESNCERLQRGLASRLGVE